MELQNRRLTHTLRFAPVRLDDEPAAHLAPVRQGSISQRSLVIKGRARTTYIAQPFRLKCQPAY